MKPSLDKILIKNNHFTVLFVEFFCSSLLRS